MLNGRLQQQPVGHPSLAYAQTYSNPWLMHAMVNVGFRLRNPAALGQLADSVM
jgi:hypothetical protein